MSKSTKDCYFDGWKKIFSYKGRATRREFWLFIIINIAIVLFIAGLSYFCLVGLVADRTSRGGMMLVWAWYVWLPLRALAPVILLVPIVSLGIRRMHDAGKSGWWFGGALLIKLLILPLILTAIHQIMLTLVDESHAEQTTEFIGMALSTLATICIFWLCSIPTKAAVQDVS